MYFNSFQFAGFFLFVWGVVFALTRPSVRRLVFGGRIVRAVACRNSVVLVASYVFYAAWDYRFLGLIALSTLVDYFCGARISEETSFSRRRVFLVLSVVSNLGILAFFKYYDFFAESFALFASRAGFEVEPFFLRVALPVGISFYTFQTLSYTIDIYRGACRPERNLLNFAVFVAFFPQLVAGPIERARELLPQFRHVRPITVGKVESGVQLMAIGVFKKVVIADNLAPIVDRVFANHSPTSIPVLVGTYAFAFQIYCDFSGYTDVARGCARTIGFELSKNFERPYFATTPSEFWGRWHISLSTWLRDYLYIPLGGNRGRKWRTYRNLMITMLLGGLWHGAAWTFVAWGAFHGVVLCVYRAIEGPIARVLPTGPWSRRIGRLAAAVFFFHIVCVGWILFRAESLEQAVHFIRSLVSVPTIDVLESVRQLGAVGLAAMLAALLLIVEAAVELRAGRAHMRMPAPLRAVAYALGVVAFAWIGEDGGQAFIYFQF